MNTYTFYGLTNVRSANPQHCLMFYERFDDEQSLRTYSTSYYQGNHFLNNIPMKLSDFEYIIEIVVDTNQTYIVKRSKEIVKNFLQKNGRVNYDILEQHFQKPVKGVILYDIGVPRNTNFIPYVLLDKQCIISTKILKKRTTLNRLWRSTEKCDTDNIFECIDGDSCVLKFDKVDDRKKKSSKPLLFEDISKFKSTVVGCELSKTLHKLPLSKLKQILIPYKYYAFTDYETEPYNIYQYGRGFKPLGLWFAVGDEWLQFIINNKYKNNYKYLYEVVVDKSKMIFISDLKDLYQFSQQYGVRDTETSTVYDIAWDRVVKSTKKSGLIIHPNLKSIIFKYKTNGYNALLYFKDMEWYLTWDVSSGVIWNKNGFKTFQLIYKKDEGKLIDYK